MERPKEEWKQYLKENRGFSGAVKKSFENYQEKYFRDSDDFPREEKFSTKVFVPGKIYTFTYTSTSGPSDVNPFVDKRPVILSLGRIKIDNVLLEGGINFNVIPHEIRIAILDRLYIAYKNIIKVDEKLVETKSNPKALPLDYKMMNKLFEGMGTETAFQVYDRRKMKGVKIFDYSDWISVVALNTKGIVGIPLNQILGEYIERMNKKINRLDEIKKSLK